MVTVCVLQDDYTGVRLSRFPGPEVELLCFNSWWTRVVVTLMQFYYAQCRLPRKSIRSGTTEVT